MAPQKPATLQYICLIILFVLVGAYQFRATIFYFPEFFHSQAVGWPFSPSYVGGQPLATFVYPNALNAGLKENDVLVSVTDTIARIMQAADVFAAGAPQHDDMTLVVMRVLQP
jgi:hypothetical protein